MVAGCVVGFIMWNGSVEYFVALIRVAAPQTCYRVANVGLASIMPTNPSGGISILHFSVAGTMDSVFGGKTHVLCACTEHERFKAG